jgi:hypothetical protein
MKERERRLQALEHIAGVDDKPVIIIEHRAMDGRRIGSLRPANWGDLDGDRVEIPGAVVHWVT